MCDNLSTYHMARNIVQYARSKYIKIDCHFVGDQLLKKKLATSHCSSNDQLADVFTKPLSVSRFQSLKVKLRVLPKPYLDGGVLDEVFI